MSMIHCRECGELISDSAPMCPKCGAKQNISNEGSENFMAKLHHGEKGLRIVSVIIGIVGLILYFTKKEKEPQAATTYLYCALFSIASDILCFIFFPLSFIALIVGIVLVAKD
ncbi:MAG: zinc ribbon domain-containing protein [Bacteroidales bacterium]|nr:zinc ribbon domain-containing protein [Candidatus Colimorpha onthohippi]